MASSTVVVYLPSQQDVSELVVLAGTHGFAIVEIERVCLASHKEQKVTD